MNLGKEVTTCFALPKMQLSVPIEVLKNTIANGQSLNRRSDFVA